MTRKRALPKAGPMAYALLILGIAFLVCVFGPEYDGRGGTTPPATCNEDMPCWDCETMGNRQCGPATGSTPRVKVIATERLS